MATVGVLTSRIPKIVAESRLKASLAVHKTAHDIEAGAKQRSRVDTGAMKSGWQTTIHGPFEAEVSNSVEHSIFNELGTESMPAQPMLTPAVEEAREPFERAMAAVYR
jgi:HK97 gp10 family phage protein